MFSVKAIKGVGLFGMLMKWFKHYHNADTSHKLCLLMEQYGVESYGRYWLLLELLCEKYKGDELEIEVTEGELCRKLRKPFPKKMKTFLEVLANLSLFNYKVFGKTFKFETSMLSELKQKDFRRPQLDRNLTAKKSPLRVKSKEIRVKREEEEEEESDLDQHQKQSEVLHITQDHVLNAWQKLGNRVAGFFLARSQLNKLIELNKIMNLENYNLAIERLKADPFYLNAQNKSIDMILSDEVLLRTFQKENQSDLRARLSCEN